MAILSQNLHGSLLVMLCFFMEALSLTSRSFFVVVLPRWEKEFGMTRTEATSCRALQSVMQAVMTIIGGKAADVAPRLTLVGGLCILGGSLIAAAFVDSVWGLFFLYGLLSGSGYGITNYNVAVSLTMRVVPKHRRGIAAGVCTAGSPLGQMLLIPGFEWLIEISGWRQGFGIVGVGLLLLAPGFFFLVRDGLSGSSQFSTSSSAGAAEESKSPASATDRAVSSNLKVMMCSTWFWLVSMSFFICGITAVGFIESHLYVLLTQRGLEGGTAAWSFGVLMGANGIGSVLAGVLSDIVSRSALLASIFAIRTFTFLLLMLLDTNVPLLFIFAAVFGFVDYAVVPPTAGLVALRGGAHNVGLGLGLLLGIHAAGAALGSVSAGASYDSHGGYDPSLITSMVLCGIAAFAAAAVNDMPLCRRQSAENNASTLQQDEKAIDNALPQKCHPDAVGKCTSGATAGHSEEMPAADTVCAI